MSPKGQLNYNMQQHETSRIEGNNIQSKEQSYIIKDIIHEILSSEINIEI